MKKLILLFTILATGLISAQWKSQNIVDDFGDVTQVVESYTTVGKFSNSATRNSSLKVGVTDFEDLYRIQLYEYGYGAPASLSYDWEDTIVSVKLEDGSIVSGSASLVPEGQGIYIYKKNKLGKLISTYSGTIKFGVNEDRSNYIFSIKGRGN